MARDLPVGSGDAGTVSWSTSGRGNGSYGYRVQACNIGGCGPWSGTGTVTVLLPPASAPGLSVPASSNNGSYTVSWDGVATASSYTLQESINGGGWATVQANGNGSWSASGKGNGSYGYRVQACNGGGCGPWSGTGTINVLWPPSDAPGLSVPGSSATGSYTVSWGWVATASSYTLQESVNGGGWGTVQSNGNTSWSASGKGSGSYGYRVQACNAGGCGPWSGTGSIGVTLIPAVPQGLTYTIIPPSYKRRFTVSFQAVSGATYYELHERSEWDGVPENTVNLGTATSTEFYRGDVSDTLYYKVRACGAGGCSAWSGEIAIF